MTAISKISSKNHVIPDDQSILDVPDVAQLALRIKYWRATKKSKSDPMPKQIKSLVFQLMCTGKYNNTALSKQLLLSLDQLRLIKTRFTATDKLVKQPKNKSLKPDIKPTPEMLPFKIVPHDNQKSNDFFDSNSNTNPVQNSTGNCIAINKADGANLALPSHLQQDLILNIVKAFLCYK
jgi:hypothetical protein